MKFKVGIMIFAALAVFVPNSRAQTTEKLQIEGRRPLAHAADELGLRYGIVVNYEDPAYVYERDSDDLTAPQNVGKGIRALVPKDGRLEVECKIVDGMKRLESPIDVIQALLKDHVARQNPGIFRLAQNKGMFFLIPSEVRNEKGELRNVLPILDTRITFIGTDRTLADAVSEVCRQLSEATATPVLLATMPNNLFFQRHTSLGAIKRPARDVLQDMFWETGRSLVWRLFYSIGDGKYFLNVKVAVMAGADGIDVPIPLPSIK